LASTKVLKIASKMAAETALKMARGLVSTSASRMGLKMASKMATVSMGWIVVYNLVVFVLVDLLKVQFRSSKSAYQPKSTPPP
jgi:hypothetical protein